MPLQATWVAAAVVVLVIVRGMTIMASKVPPEASGALVVLVVCGHRHHRHRQRHLQFHYLKPNSNLIANAKDTARRQNMF